MVPLNQAAVDPYSTEKTDLFEASRLAAQALCLSPGSRYILDQLCGVYGGEPIEGRLLVWPSNEFLEKKTGIPERSIRFALRNLIDQGIIAVKDSPNGKRFAQRAPNGQIVRAFGFDLSPLINRVGEFRQKVLELQTRKQEREVTFDEMTIHRRSAQEALRALVLILGDAECSKLTDRALELARVTPRRSSKGSADGFKDAWKSLREELEAAYHTATGGNNCRHKDTNNYTPDQSCNNGIEDGDAEAPKPGTDVRDLVKACPDAIDFMGEISSDRELVAAAARYRGGFGVNVSAWEEACREIGPLAAAAVFVYVLQVQIRPAPGAQQIKNVGGYYRAMCRLIREGKVDLANEIQKLVKRR